MIPDALASVLNRRFTFVVGKGGVGKTTTAAAIALWRADGGEPTHLLSTDPAHSLGDALGQRVGRGPAPADCADGLVLEELDAEAYARAWMERAGGPLADLIERGTYLRSEEVDGFLRLAYPGVDEVAAALRLAELAGEGASRVVVDTAPTGHALRLLDAGDLLGGWISAFEAMRRKAAAVGEALAGRGLVFAADAVLEELEARVETFQEEVLARADFVVVGAEGEVVERETERLEREIAARGLKIAARVMTGVEQSPAKSDTPVIGIPWRPLRPGCEHLRRWGEPAPASQDGRGGARAGAPAPAAAASGDSAAILRLLRREIVLVAGKGGVGKSTCAAALAVGLGRECAVTLYGADPAGSLADVLEVEIPPEGLEIGGRLRVRELDAEAELSAFREEHRQRLDATLERLGLARALELDRQVLDRLWSLAPPGMDEVFALVQVLEVAGHQDTLIVDAAPTGHFLRLMRMPELARDWTRQLLRLMLKTRELAGLDEEAERLLGFARRIGGLIQTLKDPGRTGVLLVTLREPMVAAETARLAAALTAGELPLAAVLVNQAPAAEPRAEEHGRASVPEIDPSAPQIRAPVAGQPPEGEDALLRFFETWRLAERRDSARARARRGGERGEVEAG